ncbi:alpha/beta fold hydrolase [Occultella glacieicola]|uniref:Alpha/beta fold hydrolase n=1 Tax=Occultella glacieicola TaxID=2518684 RepID=A0ABY2E0U4_9MICO|nr:alpha/beta hydrolase [Occultella glacieicola]TDE90882.1 alpha/beta fold hydrolase [Occultella glacieicola]
MYVTSAHEGAGPSVLFLHGGNIPGWMWHDQVEALPDHHCLVPDLPGFGASAALDWTSLADVADRAAAIVADRADGGRAHVVGMSMGAVVGTVLTARHPEVVHSALLTGALLEGVGGLARRLNTMQLRLWDRRWYWAAQARMFGLPPDAVEQFVSDGLAMRVENMRAVVAEVYEGLPAADLAALGRSEVPVLGLAGQRDMRPVREALRAYPDVAAITTRLVPRMHHAWNAEDPALFNEVLRDWLTCGAVNRQLMPAGARRVE